MTGRLSLDGQEAPSTAPLSYALQPPARMTFFSPEEARRLTQAGRGGGGGEAQRAVYRHVGAGRSAVEGRPQLEGGERLKQRLPERLARHPRNQVYKQQERRKPARNNRISDEGAPAPRIAVSQATLVLFKIGRGHQNNSRLSVECRTSRSPACRGCEVWD